MHKSIKIKNIYYMLSYVHDKLKSKEYSRLDAETFSNAHDLFATILSISITKQIKQGLHKEYTLYSDELSMVRGKISIEESIKRKTLTKSKLFCIFDEFDENNKANQAIKASIYLLIRHGNIQKDKKNTLKNLLLYFSNVTEVSILDIKWQTLLSKKLSSPYSFLINICYLLVKSLVITEKKGRLRLLNWFNEEQLSSLYEKFILNYYKIHYPKLSPHAKKIKWNILEDDDCTYLPEMQSDITLSHNNKTLIIDTKLYTKTLRKSFKGERKKFISSHLYQIYTYVKNHDIQHTGNVAGMLLYAQTDEKELPNHDYVIDGSKISLKTLNLDCDWSEITNQLDSFIHWVIN